MPYIYNSNKKIVVQWKRINQSINPCMVPDTTPSNRGEQAGNRPRDPPNLQSTQTQTFPEKIG